MPLKLSNRFAMRFNQLWQVFDVSADSSSRDVIRLLRLFDKFDDTSISTGRCWNMGELVVVSKFILVMSRSDLPARTVSASWLCTLGCRSTSA
jgi:hypothetical protein